ncbi:hypothetical protein GALMADRAFT_912758 [Galerina marginata CBS 339.88]|uniref:Uncharacterized protein n=1 Tax=Galerina marginata (strain CBS 339.88) TaxID=685588 RepID=A0A067SQA0_GALM3|nr:hypothetical protein GALMADRAFT_912758 [Galerina marginata CBS 339.88]
MPFLFTRNKTKNTREGLCIRSAPRTSGIVSNATSRSKQRRPTRRHSEHLSPASAASVSQSLSSSSSSSPRMSMGIADIVLDANQYTALLQAAAVPDAEGSQGQATEQTLAPIAVSEVPPCTPLPQPCSSVIAEDSPQDGSADAIVEGITYDAILASTVKKTLDISGDERLPLPETQAPPNSPAATMQRGEFGSLFGVSMAIVESRI